MFNHSINTAPAAPGQQLHHGDVFNPQSPGHHLLAFIGPKAAQPVEQGSDGSNIDSAVNVNDFRQISYAQPAVERLVSYIRLQCHDGFLLEYRSLVFDKNSLGHNQPAWIEAEDLFVWKRSDKAISNG